MIAFLYLLTAVEGGIMSNLIPGNHKHLSLQDRLYIEKALSIDTSFKDIARFLCKDLSTISKEVKKRRLSDWYHKGSFYNAHNFCIHRYHCRKTNVCGKIILCGIKCSSCPTCNQTCKDFVRERCSRLDKAPFVCNGCGKAIHKCTIAHKYVYDARFADLKYRETLTASRSGINMTKSELEKKDKLVSHLIYQGQSPYQIVANHPQLDMSVHSVYTYIDKGLFTARNIDLKRKTKRPRKCHKTQITNRDVFSGRMYSDFLSLDPDYMERASEMDTVHSSRDSKKALLTFYLRKEKLFLAFLMNRCTTGAVRIVFDRLKNRLDTNFHLLLHAILTDRGAEFGAQDSLEASKYREKCSRIFYCDPMRSGQKGGVENAHTLLRMVLPKGASFEFLTQWNVNLIVNHINSMPRESLDEHTPYETALWTYGENTLKALQLRPVSPDEVNLTPKLIRLNH